MNYLGHLLLSHATPDAITGAMLGDFVKGRVPDHWGAEVQAAIVLHRDIDRYTDRHPAVVASRALISAERRRFAGVMVDIFFDHFLARHWPRYHSHSLPDFAREVYRVLLPRRATFPERLRRIVPFMAADDWLSSYADIVAVDATLNGIARRFRYPERAQVLTTAVAELERNYTELEQCFSEFFPQLRVFASRQWGEYDRSAAPVPKAAQG
jgi:acyl carrier protein phosphodiesterase